MRLWKKQWLNYTKEGYSILAVTFFCISIFQKPDYHDINKVGRVNLEGGIYGKLLEDI